MRAKIFTLTILFALLSVSMLTAQTARVQIIHNSADAAADSVDVYLNGDLTLDDFAFRNATPFLDVAAGTPIDVGIAPKNSTTVDDTIFNANVTFTENETYIVVANGIVSTSGYSPSPDFGLDVFAQGREAATSGSNTDLLVYHGSTDAPTVDVYETSAGELVNDISYNGFSASYLELPTDDYYLQVRDQAGTTNLFAYDAPLATLGLDGAAGVVLASGFVDPSVNSDGPGFGLFVALPSGGELVELPQSTARVQVIHNSADDAADSVDVYLNDELLLDDFPFRYATPFIDAPANTEISIDVAPKTSSSSGDGIYNLTTTLTAGEKYVLAASGIVSGSGYSPATPFAIDVFAMGREMAMGADSTDVLIYHGSTDAPTVDVVEANLPLQLSDNLGYGEFSADYLELPADDYSVQIQDETGYTNVQQFGAPLSSLGLNDSALVVVASGFLDPSQNSDGPGFGLYVALPSGGEMIPLPTEEQSKSMVQAIHNSADAAADTVDIYLNDQILLNDFAFRNASPFVEVDAGTKFDISVQPKTSSDTTGALAQFTYQLGANNKYVLVANGIVSGSGYTPAEPFNIYVSDMGRTMASASGNTDVMVFHGATDAPAVDVMEPNIPLQLVDDLSYGAFSPDYLELATADYSLQVQDETGYTAVAQFQAPLSGLNLTDSALVVVASGFLDTTQNENNVPFGLYAALPSGGELVELPVENVPKAKVQVIHNSADAAADSVDIYLNDGILLDDFAFRNASPFVEVDAGTNFDISVQPKTSSDTTNALAQFTYQLGADNNYVLVANGIVSGSGYTPAEPFNIYVSEMGRTMASTSGNTDVLVFHGSTDAPTVDVQEPNAGLQLIDNLSYGAFTSDYLELATADYSLQIQDETGYTAVAQFQAPLSGLNLTDSALVVVASGFLDTTQNANDVPFGLYAALPSGGELVELPAEDLSTAKVQVIHNSADAAASSVDVYLNDEILLDDFGFRQASPFVDVTAGVNFDISVQPSSSSDTTGALAQFTYNLKSGVNYELIASGLVSTSGYDPLKPFDIKVFEGARLEASQSGNTDVLVFHGATDAPVVDVYESSVPAGTLVNNLAYGSFSADYLELATADYILDIQDETGSTTVERYKGYLDSLGLGDEAIVIVASGFLTPGDNNEGAAFGLYAALPSGGDLVALPVYTEPATGIDDEFIADTDLNIYPNPVSTQLTIDIQNRENQNLRVELYNVLGKKVTDVYNQAVSSENVTVRYDVSELKEGLYFISITNGESRVTRKIQVVK